MEDFQSEPQKRKKKFVSPYLQHRLQMEKLDDIETTLGNLNGLDGSVGEIEERVLKMNKRMKDLDDSVAGIEETMLKMSTDMKEMHLLLLRNNVAQKANAETAASKRAEAKYALDLAEEKAYYASGLANIRRSYDVELAAAKMEFAEAKSELTEELTAATRQLGERQEQFNKRLAEEIKFRKERFDDRERQANLRIEQAEHDARLSEERVRACKMELKDLAEKHEDELARRSSEWDARLRMKVTDVELALAEKHAHELEALRDEASALRGDVATWKAKTALAERALAEHVGTDAAVVAEAARLRAELAFLNARVAADASEVTKAAASVASLEKERNALKSRVKAAEEARTRAEHGRRTAEAKVAEAAKTKHPAACIACADNAKAKVEMESAFAGAYQENTSLRAANSKLTASLAELKKDHKKALAQLHAAEEAKLHADEARTRAEAAQTRADDARTRAEHATARAEERRAGEKRKREDDLNELQEQHKRVRREIKQECAERVAASSACVSEVRRFVTQPFECGMCNETFDEAWALACGHCLCQQCSLRGTCSECGVDVRGGAVAFPFRVRIPNLREMAEAAGIARDERVL